MILEIIMISIIGTLLHFTYEWSRHNKVVGLFSAVNESTWEHIKITLSAIFICSLFDAIFYGTNPNYFVAKFLSLITVIILMPLIFYTYTAFTRKEILIIDILSFYVIIVVSQLLFNYVLNLTPLDFPYIYLGTIGVFVLFGFYMVVTLLPLKNFIFLDPITKKYGLKGHSDNFLKHK